MEYVYAAMLLHKAGKAITEDTLTQVLTAAGLNVDTVRVKALVASLTEIDIDEAIKSAPTMMAPIGAPAVTTPPAEKAEEKEEAKKKEKEEEEDKEEAALEGLGALFG